MSTLKAGNIQPQSDSDPLVLSTNAAERMRIDTNGNVGIATNSPVAPLHVFNNSYGACELRLTDTSVATADWGILTQTANTTKVFRIIDRNTGSGAFADRLAIDSSGKVGIGTISPTGLLTVFQNTREATAGGLTGSLAKSGIVLESALNGSGSPQYGPGLFWKTTANNTIPMAGIFVGGRGLGACINLATATAYADGINKIGMTVTDGKVGIGTTGPTSTLQVVGDVSVSGGITAGSFSAGNIAPRPTSSSGVGQFIALNPAQGVAAILPSGGTWAYFIVLMSGSSNWQGSVEAGVAAGGTTVGAGTAGYRWNGFCWRIT